VCGASSSASRSAAAYMTQRWRAAASTPLRGVMAAAEKARGGRGFVATSAGAEDWYGRHVMFVWDCFEKRRFLCRSDVSTGRTFN
jgi:hypothetical protein